jgi:hypothetical protein
MFAMALALVSLTRAEPPQITAAPALSYGQLTRAAPVAVAGAAITSGRFTHLFRRGCRKEVTTARPLVWLC